MTNIFKKYERVWFVTLLLTTLTALGFSAVSYCTASKDLSKCLLTTGLFSTAAGLVQLEVSGFFEKIMEKYGDEKKYPGGPPSIITRQIIDNPDTPVRTWLRNICFFKARTGFWLIVLGTIIQIPAVWV